LRVLGAFVLAQLSLVQVLPALHHVLVHHEVCAEHGELVHSNDESHGHAVTAQNELPGYHVDSSAPHDHEHCGVSAAVRDAGVVGARPALSLEASVSAPTVASIAAASAARSIELLTLAPKLPPPVV
jgi:hypothetical protein